MALLDIASKGTDSVIKWLDRKFGGASVDVVTISGEDGTVTIKKAVNLDGAVLKVSGTQVVGAQQAAIADAGVPADLTAAGAKIDAILDVLRAHGLIAT